MKKTKNLIAALLVLSILVGIIPVMDVQAAEKYDIYAGYFYLAKGETVTFKNTKYSGKMSVVSKAGNTIKISGKKIKVTGKKSGLIVIKAGKKKIGFKIYIGGNHKDSKVNYAEYNVNVLDDGKEYKNYIACIRDRIKAKKDIVYMSWEDIAENEVVRECNRGLYIGEEIFDVNDTYPSWCDYGGWKSDGGIWYECVRCAMYYDKKSDCVFYKLFYGSEEDHLISGVEWGCWKNGSRVIELSEL